MGEINQKSENKDAGGRSHRRQESQSKEKGGEGGGWDAVADRRLRAQRSSEFVISTERPQPHPRGCYQPTGPPAMHDGFSGSPQCLH